MKKDNLQINLPSAFNNSITVRGSNNPHRDKTLSEKLKLMKCSSVADFMSMYRNGLNEIGEHFNFGEFMGIRTYFFSNGYDKVSLYYKSGKVLLTIDDFEQFPFPTNNTSDKTSFTLSINDHEHGPYIPVNSFLTAQY